MKQVPIDMQLVIDAAKVLHLLGKYRNNSMDVKIHALHLSEAFNKLIASSLENKSDH